MSRRPGIPTYRTLVEHGHELAVVTLFDARTRRRRTYRLGAYNTPASREAYARLIVEWESRGRRLPGARGPGSPVR